MVNYFVSEPVFSTYVEFSAGTDRVYRHTSVSSSVIRECLFLLIGFQVSWLWDFLENIEHLRNVRPLVIVGWKWPQNIMWWDLVLSARGEREWQDVAAGRRHITGWRGHLQMK